MLDYCDYCDSYPQWLKMNPKLNKFDQFNSESHFTSDDIKPTPNTIISISRPRFDLIATGGHFFNLDKNPYDNS